MRYNVGAAFDGTYSYLHMKEVGLLKVGTGENGSTLARVYSQNKEFKSGEKCKLAFIGEKLLCRSSDCQDKPFVEVDRETLEEIEQPGEEGEDERKARS